MFLRTRVFSICVALAFGFASVSSVAQTAGWAEVEVINNTSPVTDPALFDVTLNASAKNEKQFKNLSTGDTTGKMLLAARTSGSVHRLRVDAGDGTALANYDSRVDCVARDSGAYAAGALDLELELVLEPGDDLVCTFTHARLTDSNRLTLEMRAEPVAVQAPGGDVDFILRIINAGDLEARLTGLVDAASGDLTTPEDVHGAIWNNTCADLLLDGPLTVGVAEDISCTFTAHVDGLPGDTHTRSVVAKVDTGDADASLTLSAHAVVSVTTAEPDAAPVDRGRASSASTRNADEAAPEELTPGLRLSELSALERLNTTLEQTLNAATAPPLAAIDDVPASASDGWQRVDLHVHSSMSLDAYADLGVLTETAKALGYNALFLTEHDTSMEKRQWARLDDYFPGSWPWWEVGTVGILDDQLNALEEAPAAPVFAGDKSMHLMAQSDGLAEVYNYNKRGPNFRSPGNTIEVAMRPVQLDPGSSMYISISIGGDPSVPVAPNVPSPIGYTTQDGTVRLGKSIVLVWQLGDGVVTQSGANTDVYAFDLGTPQLGEWTDFSLDLDTALGAIPLEDRPIDHSAWTHIKMAVRSNGGRTEGYFDAFELKSPNAERRDSYALYRQEFVDDFDEPGFASHVAIEVGGVGHINRFDYIVTNPDNAVDPSDGTTKIVNNQSAGYPTQLNHPTWASSYTPQEAIDARGFGADMVEIMNDDQRAIWDDILLLGEPLIATRNGDEHDLHTSGGRATYVYVDSVELEPLMKALFEGRVVAGNNRRNDRIVLNLQPGSSVPYPARYPVYVSEGQTAVDVHLRQTGLPSNESIAWISQGATIATNTTTAKLLDVVRSIPLTGASTYVRAQQLGPTGGFFATSQAIIFKTVPELPPGWRIHINEVLTANDKNYTKLFIKGITDLEWDDEVSQLRIDLENPVDALVDLRINTPRVPDGVTLDGIAIAEVTTRSAFDSASAAVWYYDAGLLYIKALHGALVATVVADLPPGPANLPTVTLSLADTTATEDGADLAQVRVTRAGDIADDLTVDYVLAGSAQSGLDFEALSGSVVIASGLSSVSIDIVPIDDNETEGDEALTFTIDSSSVYNVGSPNSTTITIIDDDTAPPPSGGPTVTVSAADRNAGENNSATGRFRFSRYVGLDDDLSVLYSISGTATNGDDYATLPGTIVIPAGENHANVLVTPVDDTIGEGDETVIVTLDTSPDYDIGNSASGTVTITDNDPISVLPSVSVSLTDEDASESGADPGSITMTRVNDDLAADLTVAYTVQGSATPGTDYEALSGSLIIPAGQASATLVVLPLDDALPENTETVVVVIQPGTSYEVGGRTGGTVSIADDDGDPPPVVSMVVSDEFGAEEGLDPARATVTRSGSQANELIVIYTIVGSASPDLDYETLSGTVVIPPGQASADIVVRPIDDADVEGDETVFLNLDATAEYSVDAASSVTLVIVDNDTSAELPIVSLDAEDERASEAGLGTASVRVTRTGDVSEPLSVPYTVGGSATAGLDYVALDGVITLNAGESSALLVVTPIDDIEVESEESIDVSIADSATFKVGERGNVTLFVDDDDPTATARPLVSVSASDPQASEAGPETGTFLVSRTVSLSEALTVTFAVSGSATQGSDYTALGTSVTLAAGVAQATVTVTPQDDLAVEGDEVVSLTLQSDPAYDLDASVTADVIIADDDEPVSAAVTRGPYLQSGTPDSVVIRWRTDVPTTSRVVFGPSAANLNDSESDSNLVTEHIVTLTDLLPDTRYFYAVGSVGEILAGGDASHAFVTSPPVGTDKATRLWVLGDSGTANANAQAVRDAYKSFTGERSTDLWLMLGDNAYNDGTDSEYQAAVFETYPEILRQSVLWPTLGNHDGFTADSASQSGPYYDIFSLPTNAEAGGIASGTEAYYSFDYGNIHFISLESYETDRSTSGAMMSWLEEDLAATEQEWIIAFWHHPPYSKGSHDSDSELRLRQMRENALPILEAYGVDLVLSGHSHSYERSFLLDSHYGDSSTFDPPTMLLDGGDGAEDGDGAYNKAPNSVHSGAVYAVAGSSGRISNGPLNHPAMFVSLVQLGSMVIDVDGARLDALFLDSNGDVQDRFSLLKDGAPSDTEIVRTRIANGSDDAEQTGASVTLGSSDLELVEDGADVQAVGMRFTNVDVPKDAVIVSAYVQFKVDEISTAAASLVVEGQASDDAQTFGNVLTRPRTSEAVSWVPDDWPTVGASGTAQRTPDLSAVISEIVSRPGWTRGNALAVIVTGSGRRTAESFEGDAAGAPLLHIEYEAQTGVQRAPSVDAGENQSIVLGDGATLNATVTDDGLPNPPGEITTLWSQQSGPGTATFDDATAVATSVTFDEAGTYVLRLVADDSDRSSFADVTIIVDAEASSGTVTEVRVSAGSDDAELRENGNTSISSTDLELVEDGSNTQTVGIRFASLNVPPGAVILRAYIQFQADETGSVPTSLIIEGEAADSPPTFGAIDGRARTAASVAWDPAPWNSIGETGLAQRTPDLSAIVEEVTSRAGWNSGNAIAFFIDGSGTRTARAYEGLPAGAALLHVEYEGAATQLPPSVAAGADQSIAFGEDAALDGTVSDDGLPNPPGLVTTLWRQTAGPGTAVFSDASAIDTTVSFDAAGVYTLELSADDGALINTASVDITVTAPAQLPPVVLAGDNQSIVLGDGATLAATVTDDGLPNPPGNVTVLWSQVSGPGTVSFAVDTASNTTATFSEVGAYTLRITADDSALSAFDEVIVTVTEPGTTGRVTTGLLALYPFDEGAGETVNDQSGVGAPLDLNIANPGNVTWGEGTLTINVGTRITSDGAAAKLNSAIPASGAITVEAWLEPANATQSGPARIVSISLNGNSRNMTLGQGKNRKPGTHYDMRLRTTSTDNNGRPTLSTPEDSLTTNLTHVVYTRDADGNATFYLDGASVSTKNVGGDMSNWEPGYALALANEQSGDRAWLGLFDLVAIYSVALSPAQVLQNFSAGPDDSGDPVDNTPPVAVADQVATSADTLLTGNILLANGGDADQDADGDTLSVSAVNGQSAAIGSQVVLDSDALLTLNADGSFAYNPDGQFDALSAGETASDSFEYTVTDGTAFDVATVTVTITGVNDAPVLAPVANVTLAEETTQTVNLDGTDVDSDSLALTLGPGSPAFVSLIDNSDGSGSITVEPLSGDAGSYTVTIVLSDDASPSLSDTQELSITITEPGSVGRVTAGLLALYPFDDATGATVSDQSGVGAPLDLTIADLGNTTWGSGTLSVDETTTILSAGPATKINNAIQVSNAITVEAWVAPANATQSGPARIVALSVNGTNRNMTLGQGKNRKPGTHYDMRLRTTSTDDNGRPTLSTPENSLSTNLTHVVYTRDVDGNATFYLDGVPVSNKTVGGNMSNWNAEYALALANEPRGDRPWLGMFDLVAIYELALSPAQVLQNFNAGPGG